MPRQNACEKHLTLVRLSASTKWGMQSLIQLQVMNEEIIPSSVVVLLHESGLSEKTICSCVPTTRIYHDLGLYGDTAWWFTEELSKRIDMSGFCFEEYFPPEFGGKNSLARLLLSLLPFANWLYRRGRVYEPITLEMISNSLEAGRWLSQRP